MSGEGFASRRYQESSEQSSFSCHRGAILKIESIRGVREGQVGRFWHFRVEVCYTMLACLN